MAAWWHRYRSRTFARVAAWIWIIVGAAQVLGDSWWDRGVGITVLVLAVAILFPWTPATDEERRQAWEDCRELRRFG